MSRQILSVAMAISFLLAQGGKTALAAPKLPEVEGKPALARVNGETVFLDDLLRELSAIHEGAADNSVVSPPNLTAILDRMIDSRLIVQEAQNIGLDELPEVKRGFEAYGKRTMRSMLLGRQVRDIRKPDRNEVDKRYREAVKEVKLASVGIGNETEAKRLEAEVGAGGDFQALAKRMIDEGVATGSAEGEFLKFRSLLPQVADAVSRLKTGKVTPLIKVGDKYAMAKLLGVRFPEDPEARRRVEEEALRAQRTAALKSYTEGLKKKYAKVDEKLLAELDYDSPEPGFEKLMKDGRVLAEVKGEKPVTVQDLSEALMKKFFHGMEGAAKKGRINRMKEFVLDDILFDRVTEIEARRQKIDRSPEYLRDVEEDRRATLFGEFIRKVIEPGIRFDAADLKRYMEEHIGEYTFPEMMRIERIAFSRKKDAEKAAEKLRNGSDFQWIRANAEGRVDPGGTKDLLSFGEGPMVTGGLPKEIQKAVAGAVGGEYRVYSLPGGISYVLYVREVIPPAPRPFESVREQVAKSLFERKRLEALKEYVRQLRGASDVKVFAAEKALRQIVRERGR